jgi:antitoxin VapB
MKVDIDDPEFEQVIRELSAVTGEPAEVLVKVSVRERLDRVNHRKGRETLERLRPILDRISAMPVHDPRPADEILGYNERGTFD